MSNNIPIQENRKFKMHNNLLHTIIFKQSGSIEKAILELLMNSNDANSTRIDINYDSTKDTFTIADDGKGFTTDEEIEAFFDTLGTPHKDGDAKFGRFRIGRTQIFAYASTVWRSGTYRMTVDFLNDNENELGYKLEKNLPFQKGCIITGNRYSAEQLNTNFLESLSSVIRTVLNEYFPYSDIPIYVNSELKVIANNECKWDLETNNAYYKFNNYRGANIYNMGAFVKSYDGSYFGIGVDIVSKKALDINFARNDIILYNCKVFQDISEEIKNYVNRIALKKNRLNEEEKKYIYTQFMNGELEYHQVRNIKMFTDVFGKDFSFEEFVKAKRVTFSDGKSGKLAEKVHESKTALVFNSNFSYLFGNNDFREFINAIWDKMDLVLSSIDKKHPSYNIIKNDLHSLNRQRCTTNIKDFESSFSTNHEIFETSQLSKKEQILLKSVRRLNDIFYKEYSVLLRCKKRKIVFGDSLVSDAWTDGASYIAINKKFTPISEQGTKFFSHILLLIVHEYCHNDFTTNEHPHNQEFYKLYHDITLNGGFKELENDLEMESISNLPKRASLTYYNELENNDIKAPKKLKQEMSHTQEYKDNKVVESFISHFGDYYWKKTNRTFEDFIQELFLSPKNDFNVIEKYILTKNKITQALLNSDSFDSRDLFIKIDDISRFVDFTIANLVKLFKTTTIVMILKNINSLIEAYNNRDRDYSIETAIKKELKEDINYRKASTFVYMYKTDIFYGRMDRNLHICVITDEIYNRVKKEYEELYPDLFKKLTINKNLKEKLSIIKKDIEDYNNNKDAKYDEFIKIKNFANEVVPCMSIIMPLKEYLSFEKLGYNPCLRQTHRLYFYEYEPIETSIVGNKLVQIV